MKKIVAILITLTMVFSLTACGKADEDTTRCDNNNNNPFTVYLKWTDGEEELHPYEVHYNHAIATLYFEGYSIDVAYENVIIYDYR